MLFTARFAVLHPAPLIVLLTTGGCQVSTKSGLDPSGVWQAWGMASLLAGNFSGAREKLGRCLKPPVDRNQINLGPALLQEVVRQLENNVAAPLSRVGGTAAAALWPFTHGPTCAATEAQVKLQHTF